MAGGEDPSDGVKEITSCRLVINQKHTWFELKDLFRPGVVYGPQESTIINQVSERRAMKPLFQWLGPMAKRSPAGPGQSDGG